MDDGEGDGDTADRHEIFSIGEDDPINVDDVYVNNADDNSIQGVRRPAFLPAQAGDDGNAAQDEFGSAGDPRTAGHSACSEAGTEGTEEAESTSRISLLSNQRGRHSAWGPARTTRQPRGPYGGGEAVILPGAETPTGAKGSKETWADVTENAAEGGAQSWQEDHRNTLNQWKTHQPETA